MLSCVSNHKRVRKASHLITENPCRNWKNVGCWRVTQRYSYEQGGKKRLEYREDKEFVHKKTIHSVVSTEIWNSMLGQWDWIYCMYFCFEKCSLFPVFKVLCALVPPTGHKVKLSFWLNFLLSFKPVFYHRVPIYKMKNKTFAYIRFCFSYNSTIWSSMRVVTNMICDKVLIRM